MRVILRPMTEEFFQTYMREHEEEYARDRMITDQESFEQALQATRAQHAGLLPHGLLTTGHYFFTVHDEHEERQVGCVWFAGPPSSPQLSLYCIRIHQADRRRGYGRAVLEAVEKRAKELARQVIWLNVMGHNQGAIEFYRACGYHVAAMHMNRFLGPA